MFLIRKKGKKRKIKDKLDSEDIDKFVETILEDVNIETERGLKFHQRVKFRDLNIVLLLAFTGIRISELVQLDINDVSIKDGAMVVVRKGGDEDKIYLPDVILSTLQEFIQQRKTIDVTDTENKEALFLSLQGKRIDPRTVRQMLNKYKQRAGISMKVTPHTFRRTFAIRMYNETGDMQLTADYLGHKSVETTRGHYAEPEEDRKRKVMKNFNYDNISDDLHSEYAEAIKEVAVTKQKDDVIESNLKELAKLTGRPLAQLKKELGLHKTNKDNKE